jgi:flagellar biosynthetic protein FliR
MPRHAAGSFTLLPVGAGNAAPGLRSWTGAADLSTGLTIALPVIAALLITNIALGSSARRAAVEPVRGGFPITIMIGWVVLGCPCR